MDSSYFKIYICPQTTLILFEWHLILCRPIFGFSVHSELDVSISVTQLRMLYYNTTPNYRFATTHRSRTKNRLWCNIGWSRKHPFGPPRNGSRSIRKGRDPFSVLAARRASKNRSRASDGFEMWTPSRVNNKNVDSTLVNATMFAIFNSFIFFRQIKPVREITNIKFSHANLEAMRIVRIHSSESIFISRFRKTITAVKIVVFFSFENITCERAVCSAIVLN
jgi:hypothetical protein